MDIQPEKTCCFAGHRPKFFPWGSNTGDPAAAKMLHALESEILQAIADGYTTFLYGGALGVDTWTAETVLRLRKKLPLTLIAVLPFPGYNADVTEDSYRQIIAESDRTLILPEVGVSNPPIMFSKVDLPLPEVPTMATNSPSSMDRVTPSNAFVMFGSVP